LAAKHRQAIATDFGGKLGGWMAKSFL
jgi:hypothetical protein